MVPVLKTEVVERRNWIEVKHIILTDIFPKIYLYIELDATTTYS